MGKRTHEDATISVANTFTEWLQVDKGERFAVSSELPTGTTIVTVQRRLAGAAVIRDVEAFTADSLLTDLEQDGIAAEAMEVRIGVKTAELDTGTPYVRIGK